MKITEQIKRDKILVIEETDTIKDMYKLCGQSFDTVFLPIIMRDKDCDVIKQVLCSITYNGAIREGVSIYWYEPDTILI